VPAGSVDLDRESDPVVEPPRRLAAPDLIQQRLQLSLQVGSVGMLAAGLFGDHRGVYLHPTGNDDPPSSRHFPALDLASSQKRANSAGMLLHFLWPGAQGWYVETETPTLQQALFWMNIYRDLLAVDETALLRMRALMTEKPVQDRGNVYYIPDVELVIGEIERVRGRLDHWLGLVDLLR
jgi:hypothetical protein